VAKKDFRSVAEMFNERVKSTPDVRAFQFPKGEDGWEWITWAETGARVRAIALGLRQLGLEVEQRCSILSTTRMEWVLADLGVMCGGGVTTTIYASNTQAECAYIITDSQTAFIFAEDDQQVAKLVGCRAEIPGVKHVISFTGSASHDGWVITLDQLEAKGREQDEADPGAFEDIVASVAPDQLATLIYTSGTTGAPKGVELTHDCWVFEAQAIEDIGILSPTDHQYLWLPLSHVFGKVLEAAQLQIGFPTTIDGRVPKLVQNLGVVRPTFMAAAPRIFEKVYNKVVSGTQQAGGLKLKAFTWAVGVGRQVSALRQEGRELPRVLKVKHTIATTLVFAKLKNRFGGRIRFFLSGAAPLSRELAEFFHAADILILEGYGLTESSGASFVNGLATYAFGTVGTALPGIQVKIAEEDGEISLKGRGVMRGYHNKPDETAATIENGWLRTGDIGELDNAGRLRITDRKKDLIKTSGGEYVAPQALEGRLKSLCPYISQVLVHGNNRNFCTALICIDEESIGGWCAENSLDQASYADLAKHLKVVGMIQTAVDELNSGLASYASIKKFAMLPKDLTVEDGELTASLKVKRKVVEARYSNLLDEFYERTTASL